MSSSLSLLELPAEILSQILQPFLLPGAHEPVSLLAHYTGSSITTSNQTVVSVLLIHPRIYNLGVALLYGPENEFLLDLTGSNHIHARKLLQEIAEEREKGAKSGNHYDQGYDDVGYNEHNDLTGYESLGHGCLLRNRDVLRRVSRLTLRLDRIRGWMSTRVVPLLEDMILRGGLIYLDIILSAKGRGGESLLSGAVAELQQQHRSLEKKNERDCVPGQPREGSGGSSGGGGGVKTASRESIMVELLGLLADPYVRRGRLFASTAHHRGRRSSEANNTIDGEEKLEELDWRAMMAENHQVHVATTEY